MNEEEKKEIELDIEAKYVDKTEKEFLSRVTYAECLFILTPENKYCDKIKELSVLKICEIIEKLQKENEKLKDKLLDTTEGQKVIKEETPQYIKENYIPVQKVIDKIEELDIAILECEYSDDDSEEYKKEVEKDKLELLKQKRVLQELLEKEDNKNG